MPNGLKYFALYNIFKTNLMVNKKPSEKINQYKSSCKTDIKKLI